MLIVCAFWLVLMCVRLCLCLFSTEIFSATGGGQNDDDYDNAGEEGEREFHQLRDFPSALCDLYCPPPALLAQLSPRASFFPGYPSHALDQGFFPLAHDE
ncbi:hypothetical protein L596_004755 [Steinernema carpocapsae]|uniref:Secreted protein n=1 Tax=Steinernema carpocapsae TaxID=34508 RepID=A0A4U8UWS4_STECR|nr:hypothetical protein L596_004755 [Steinernema carpocapsae]